MKGCLQIVFVVVIIDFVGNLFFDLLDRIQEVLENIPGWVWIIGVLVVLGIFSKE